MFIKTTKFFIEFVTGNISKYPFFIPSFIQESQQL